MKAAADPDPVLAFVDEVLADLAVRSRMYVGRRREAGDAETFVIQTGEEGRRRLGLPDLRSDRSIETAVAAAQAYLGEVLNAPVPLCPLHEHALLGSVSHGRLNWACPAREWACELRRYEHTTWPQRELGSSLAPVLLRRLERRGTFPAVRTIPSARPQTNSSPNSESPNRPTSS